jgi:hypothetical protein
MLLRVQQMELSGQWETVLEKCEVYCWGTVNGRNRTVENRTCGL